MLLKFILFLATSLVISCSGVNSARYKDTSDLEKPPKMKIVERSKLQVKEKEEIKNTGLGQAVSLIGTTEQPVMKIKKLIDRSWSLVEQALKLKAIEITDKNREQGVFYVLFDPDGQNSDDSSIIDKMSFFFIKDKFEAAPYKLFLIWNESNTEVRVELADREHSSLLDDDEDMEDFASSVDSGAMLINELYRTMKDDLPLK